MLLLKASAVFFFSLMNMGFFLCQSSKTLEPHSHQPLQFSMAQFGTPTPQPGTSSNQASAIKTCSTSNTQLSSE